MLKLKELREEKGIYQKELALKLNRTSACISSWEKNKTEPSIIDIIKIAEVFNTSTDELLGRADYGTGLVNINNQLSKFESNLLTVVKKLTKEDQYQVLGFAMALAN